MIDGSCHCGSVKWQYDKPLENVTACNCSLCSRYGALWAYGHVGEGISISGNTKAYARGRKINGFHFCETCGCLAFYMANAKDEKGRFRIAVNMRMASDPTRIAGIVVRHFDGLDKFEDLPDDQRSVKDLWN